MVQLERMHAKKTCNSSLHCLFCTIKKVRKKWFLIIAVFSIKIEVLFCVSQLEVSYIGKLGKPCTLMSFIDCLGPNGGWVRLFIF